MTSTTLYGYRAVATITNGVAVLTAKGAVWATTNFSIYDHFKVSKSGWLIGYWKHIGALPSHKYYRDSLVKVGFRQFDVIEQTSECLMLKIKD